MVTRVVNIFKMLRLGNEKGKWHKSFAINYYLDMVSDQGFALVLLLADGAPPQVAR